jgi:hypothetical protein
MKRMYYLNPSQLKAIPIAAIVFYDPNKSIFIFIVEQDFYAAKNYT